MSARRTSFPLMLLGLIVPLLAIGAEKEAPAAAPRLVDPSELVQALPKIPPGWVEARKPSTGKIESDQSGMSTAIAEWRKDKASVSVSIMDIPSNEGSPIPGGTDAKLEVVGEKGDRVRTFQLDGFPAFEEFRSEAGEYTLMVTVAHRFMISIHGTGIDPALGLSLWKQIDRRKLTHQQ